MKTGMFLTPIHRQGRSYGEMYKLIGDTIVELDQLGYDEVYLGEHYTARPEPVSNPLQFYSSLLPRTRRIRFGTGVLNLPHHHPAQVAADAAMFDHMSGGRFILGVGTGGLPSDFELFGTMEAPRGEMMLESLDMIRRIWSQDPPYEFDGKFWKFRVRDTVMADLDLGFMPRPFQKDPPIVVSSMMPNSGLAGLAGEHGWGYISANFVSPGVLRSHRLSYEAGCAKAGRTPDPEAWRVVRSILVTDTDAIAEDYLANPDNNITAYYRFLHTQMSRMGMLVLFKPDASMPDEQMTLAEAHRQMVIAGSVDTVVQKLRALEQDIGSVGGLFLAYHDPADRPRLWSNSMRLFQEAVVPALRSGRP